MEIKNNNEDRNNLKNVGIITYHYFYNYGTMLQAFATQEIIKRVYECNTNIIDYRFNEKIHISFARMLSIRIKRFSYYITHLNEVLTKREYQGKLSRKNRLFDDFFRQHFSISPNTYYYKEELKKNPPKYDVYVTGSDQTWSPKIGFNPALFLDFVPAKSVKASYAPSIGVTSFTAEERAYIKEHLAKYDYLSCRETLGANLLKEVTGKDVEIVLDPTLVLNSDDWRRFAQTPEVEIKRPYILCYFLGDRMYYRDFVKQLSQQTGYDVYYIPVSWVDCKKGNNLIFDIGPAEFLHLIDNAEYVCTDSFHGTAFCINFNTQFFTFVKHAGSISGGDNSRIYDLLSRMNLTDRLKEKYNYGEQIDLSAITFEDVNKLLNAERITSTEYLKKILQ